MTGADLLDLPSLRRKRRARQSVVVVVLSVLLFAAVAVSVGTGDFDVPLPDVVRTLFGGGTRFQHLAIVEFRLPRTVLAILAGAALALSGAIFQALLRNALASPDIVGVTGGASVAAVLAILVLDLSGTVVSLFAFCGALAVAALVYLLAWDGGVAGARFVLVGVGIAFMVTGAIGYLLTRADVEDAQIALAWLVGGVDDARWPDITVAAVSVGALMVLTLLAARHLDLLRLGDDSVTALGIRVGRARVALLLLAVALAAAGTAAAGPLAFVAFVSGPIARRLVRTGAPALVPSALVGALVVVLADYVGQHLLPGDTQVPAGVVTGAIGAPYLLWLLATTRKDAA